jgi:hypothetical protein
MITNVKPMSADHARCLAMAYELHWLLGKLYDHAEHGPGSCVEEAWDRMDEVIAALEPEEPGGERTLRALRLEQARSVRR